MIVNLSEVKSLYQQGNVIWKDHAAKRMKQRGIRVHDVEDCIMTGEIIEQYPQDYPAPSCLILGLSSAEMHLHVVCSVYQNMLCIITAYFPNPDEWEADYKTRKVVQK